MRKFNRFEKMAALALSAGTSVGASQIAFADNGVHCRTEGQPFSGSLYLPNVGDVTRQLITQGRSQPSKMPKGPVGPVYQEASRIAQEKTAQMLQLQAQILEDKSDDKPSRIEIIETTTDPTNYFTWASRMARVQGVTDIANQYRDPGDGAWKQFWLPRDTGDGGGRSSEKSGALVLHLKGIKILRFANGCDINVLEGGNLFVGMHEGMWFGTGASCSLTSNISLSAGAYTSFKTDSFDASSKEFNGKGGGIGIRVVF